METQQSRQARRYVAASLLLHLSLFLVAALGALLAPPVPFITPSVQIDMVSLPSEVKSDAPSPNVALPVKDLPPPPKPAAPEKAEPPPPTDAMTKEKDAESEAEKALKRLRQQVKKENKAEDKKRQAALEKRKEDLKHFEETYRAALRGNQLHSGSAATGAMEATMNAYAGSVVDRLRSNWALPSWLQDKGLRASVRIYIDGSGNVMRMRFTQSSGNNSFDNYVEGTVRQSSPFAPPPEEMAGGLRGSGIEVGFPL